MEQESIGFIGLGNMGGAIARRMLAKGQTFIGFDIDPKTLDSFAALGATPATSVRDVADRCRLVIVCLPTGGNIDVTRDIVQGKSIECCAEFSTMSPETMRGVQEVTDRQGVMLVDAPVSGGVTIAERGELSLMMAGPDMGMDMLEHAMRNVIAHAFRIGDTPGQAQLCKLVNNAIGFTLWIASCEALTVGAAGGIEPETLLDAVNAGSGWNSWTKDKFGPHVLSRTFDAGGKLGGGPRALDLYLDEARLQGMPPAMVQKARDVWAHMAEIGDPTRDFTSMIEHFEAQVGAELRFAN